MDVNNLEKRKLKLLKAVEATRSKKRKILETVQSLVKEYNFGRISKNEYDSKLSVALGNRSAEQWIKYYDDYLDYYKYQIGLCDKLVKGALVHRGREKRVSVLKVMIGFVLVGIFISLMFSLGGVFVNYIGDLGVEKVDVGLEFGEVVDDVDDSVIGGDVGIVDVGMDVDEIDMGGIVEEDLGLGVVVRNGVSFSEEDIQYPVVIGKSVKWKKKIIIEDIDFKVNLPVGASVKGVSVLRDGILESVDELVDIKKKSKFLFFGEKGVEVKFDKGVGVTGNVVDGDEIDNFNDGMNEFEIVYETPAPEIFEKVDGSKKMITIIGPDDVHYKNVLSFIEIDEKVKIGEERKIEIFQIVDGSRRAVKFNAYDNNENGLIDFVEWITPELSEAVFEIIIKITEAEHLDLNRNFISNIYEEVREKDGVWSEKIYPNEFVRVKFEKELDETKDITLYVRSGSNDEGDVGVDGGLKSETYIEVYFNDKKIVDFPLIDDGKYKVFLNDLDGKSDEFYLKVVSNNENGYLEFDYIVDPSGIPVSTCFELQGIGTSTGTLDDNYYLTGNIDCSEFTNFNPIGDASNDFNGLIDGQGYTIDGLQMNRVEGGLIEQISSLGVVRDIKFINSNMVLSALGGVVTKSNNGLISGVSVQGVVRSDGVGGGIVGINYDTGIIQDSYSDVLVGVIGFFPSAKLGGIAGENFNGLIQNVYSKNTIGDGVTIGASGGLIGVNYPSGIISNSYSVSSLIGTSIGGLIGDNQGTIVNSYWHDPSSSAQACVSSGSSIGCLEELVLSNFYFKTQGVYTGASPWDFNFIWMSVLNDFPELKYDSSVISNCDILNSPGTYYLTEDFVAKPVSNICIGVNSPDVTIDCQGYQIYSDEEIKAIYSNSRNTVIRNCKLRTSSSYSWGVHFGPNTAGSLIENSLIENSYYGVELQGSNGVEIRDSVFNGISNIGIYMRLGARENNFDKLNFLGSSSYGIRILGYESNNNNFSNLLMDGSFGNALLLDESDFNQFDNLKIVNTNVVGNGVVIQNFALGNNFSDCNFEDVNDVVVQTNSVDNHFLDCFYDSESVDASSELNREWSYRAYAESGIGGNFLDSISDNDGVANGDAYVENGSWFFDGTADFVRVDDNVNLDYSLTNAFTMMGWVYLDSSRADKDQIFWNKGIWSQAGFMFLINSVDQQLYYYHKFKITSGISIWSTISSGIYSSDLIGNWHHLTQQVSIENGNAINRYYLDGNLVHELVQEGVVELISSPINLDFGTNLMGSMDDVKFFNRSLSTEEIKKHYDSYFDTNGFLNYFKFDGDVLDSKTFTPTPDPIIFSYSQGVYGSAVSFDGSNYITQTVPEEEISLTGYTYSAWVKLKSGYAGHEIVISDWYPYISINSGKAYFAGNFGGVKLGIVGTTILAQDEWHYLTGVYEPSGNLKIYLDGKLEGTAGPYFNPDLIGGVRYIGKHTSAGYEFHGDVDEVRIYKRALTEEEIYKNYITYLSDESFESDVGLVSNWKGENVLENIDVDIYGDSGLLTQLVTGKNGYTNIVTLTDYVNLAGVKNYVSYTFVRGVYRYITKDRDLNLTAFQIYKKHFFGFLFDQIYPVIFFVLPTPGDLSIIDTAIFSINVSIIEENPKIINLNWDSDLFNSFDEDLSMMLNFDNVDLIGETGIKPIDVVDGVEGVVNGATWISDGRFKGGYNFDGNDDILFNVPEEEISLTGYTYSAWVKLKSGYAGHEIVISDWYPYISINSGKAYFAGNFGGVKLGIVGTTILAQDEWHYLTGVYEPSGNLKIYLDGRLEGTAGPYFNPDLIGGVRYIGKHTSAGYEFHGDVDEVRVWHRALNIDEINYQYHSNLNKYDIDKWNLYFKPGYNIYEYLSFGDYNYKASVIDVSDNYAETETRSVNLISTPPEIVYITDIGGSIGGISPEDRDLVADGEAIKEFRFYVYAEDLNSLPGGLNPITNLNTLILVKDINSPFDERLSNEVGGACSYFGPDVAPVGSVAHVGETVRVYSCSVPMRYYDDYGSVGSPNWEVKALIKNIYNVEDSWNVVNEVEQPIRFTYFNRLTDSKMIPNGGSLEFGSVSYGIINREPNVVSGIYPLEIYNTGNVNINQVNVIAYDVPGLVRSNEKISAEWFRVSGESTGVCNANVLSNGVAVNSGLLGIDKGPGSFRNMHACLREVQASASNQGYSTTGESAWTFDVIFALAVLRISSRKKKKNKLKSLMGEMFLEIFEDKLKNKYGSDIENILNELDSSDEGVMIPISIFREKEGAAEILTKYLRENLLLKFSEIAKLIKRDQRTVSINYKNAVKNKRKIVVEGSFASIPVGVFSDRKFSILESIIAYLREKEFKNSEIAKMLNRDPRNISTLYSRVRKKIGDD